MLLTSRFNQEAMARAARGGFTNATDMADYLVNRGLPFRDAHEAVGKTVRYCIDNRLTLDELDLATYRQFSPLIEDDIYEFIDVKACVARRRIPGGPAPEAVQAAIEEARQWLAGVQNEG